MKITDHLKLHEEGDLQYFTAEAFDATGVVNHGFSTRLGGVSEGCFASMNLGVTRGDDSEKVKQNYDIFCSAIGVNSQHVVLSQQTHTDHIRKVTAADVGKGLWRERDYTDVDGLITDEPGLALTVFGADCATIGLLDPKRKVIAAVHSGWRGTVKKILTKAILMMEEYGCERQDILAVIGPCIGPCHYEVDETCAREFEKSFPQDFELIAEELDTPGKYLIDLPMANVTQLLDEGIDEGHITMSNLCTYCDPDLFFSHREMGEKRGNMALILELK